MTIGQQLREAREAQGMSIGDVSRRTYIQPKFLQAIEEENIAAIPNPQRRFFVRDYARTVGVDPDALLALLPDTPPPTPVAIAPESRTPIRFDSADTERRGKFPKFKPMAFGEQRRRNTNMANWVIAAALGLLIGVGGYLAWSSGLFGGGKPTQQAEQQPPPASDADSPAQIINSPEASATPVSESSWQPGDSMTLVGRATARVWFDVVSDGQRSSTGTLDSGVVKTWRALKTFKVSLGNAGGLHLTLNDQSIGTLGPLRTAVRNQIIDSAGVRRPGGVRPATAAATSPSATPATRPAASTATSAPSRTSTTPSSSSSTARPPASRPATTNRQGGTTQPNRQTATPQPNRQTTSAPRRSTTSRTPTVRQIEPTEPRRVPRDPQSNP
ncbi:MAG: DUF4115 domain-containing protein [Armatimonadetes bacterium]|nr:DUF4115 domain-containing protein [Armatimonadota bacterium]